MAERTVDTGFDGTKLLLNEMMENANNISKSFVKHAESLEGIVFFIMYFITVYCDIFIF